MTLTMSLPRLVGDGAVEFSTSLALEKPDRLLGVVWDVNGYYAALGVPSNATRLQIREAYQRAEGWNSVRLTYIVKQLLDEETRARYDKIPLGSMMVDYWVDTAMRRAALQKNISLMGAGIMTYDEVYNAGGFKAEDVVDKDSWSGQDGDLRFARPSRKEEPSWSYYLWDTMWDSPAPEVAQVLDWWRNLLSVEVGTRKGILRLAVGLYGDPDFQQQWRIERVDYRTVVFLGDDPMDVLVSKDVPLEWKVEFLERVARSCAHELIESI